MLSSKWISLIPKYAGHMVWPSFWEVLGSVFGHSVKRMRVSMCVCVCVCVCVHSFTSWIFRASWELECIYSAAHTEVDFTVIKKAVKVVNSTFPITFIIFCPSILETHTHTYTDRYMSLKPLMTPCLHAVQTQHCVRERFRHGVGLP